MYVCRLLHIPAVAMDVTAQAYVEIHVCYVDFLHIGRILDIDVYLTLNKDYFPTVTKI
jgi:hypothetical protein